MCLYISEILACSFLGLWHPIQLCYQVILVVQNEFGSVSSSSIFWKSLRSIRVNSALKFCWNSPEKSSGSGLFFLGGFSLLTQTPYSLMVCTNFLFHSDPGLLDCMFLEMYTFLLGYPIFWCIIVHSSHLWFTVLWYQL